MSTAVFTDTSWLASARQHAQTHTLAFGSLTLGVFAVVVLLVQSLWSIVSEDMAVGVRYGLMGGLAGFATTALGALPALALRSIPQKLEDSLLGFAAGMMLAASAFSLLLPGLGAQGATAATLAPAFLADGAGAVVSASRGIQYAQGCDLDAAVAAAQGFRDELNLAAGQHG